MITLLKKLLRGSGNGAASPTATTRLRSLQIQFEESEARLGQLRTDLERERNRAAGEAKERSEQAQRRLMESIASPLTQLLTQARLSEQPGKVLDAKNVLRVVRSLIRSLEEEGLQVESEPGARISYDPNLHEPTGSTEPPSPGESVEVKFPGLRFQNRILRKAGVAPVKP